MRAEQQRAVPGSAATDGAPGSGLSVRTGAPSSRSTGTRARDESAPPTKPSIAPPSGSALRTPERPLLSESPLSPFHQPTPRLSYRMVLVLAGVALGFGGLVAATHRHDPGSSVSSLPWLLAATTLIFSLSMAVVITLSFARRLDALARAARKVAFGRGQEPEPIESDAIASLAGSLTRLAERITELTAERERHSEQEQGRLDALVRERTRELGEENEDLRRVLGDTRGVLSVDAQGKVIGQLSSQLIPKWLGAAPAHHMLFWDYFEQAAPGAGPRFESAWAELAKTPGELDVRRLPRTLAVGERYLSVEYRPVRDGSGSLRRMLVVLTDITIPEPDPATPL